MYLPTHLELNCIIPEIIIHIRTQIHFFTRWSSLIVKHNEFKIIDFVPFVAHTYDNNYVTGL